MAKHMQHLAETNLVMARRSRRIYYDIDLMSRFGRLISAIEEKWPKSSPTSRLSEE
jgi:hypothetical protein